MNRTAALMMLTVCVLVFALTANANELQVRAPVVTVEPLTDPPMEVEHCHGQPQSDAGLADLLAWDLGLNCTTELVESATVRGYRVFYRWDDRVYSQIMSSVPGDTIPLTIRLD